MDVKVWFSKYSPKSFFDHRVENPTLLVPTVIVLLAAFIAAAGTVPRLLDLLIIIFELPQMLQNLVPEVAPLFLSIWLLISNGSPLLLSDTAFASGWILHDTVRSLGQPGSRQK